MANAAIVIAVKPWTSVADFAAAGSELAKGIVEAFRARNIAMPVPQRDIRMVSGGPDQG